MRKILWLIILTLAIAHPALAHTDLESSTPAAGEVVTTAPKTVTLTFSEPINAATIMLVHESDTYNLQMTTEGATATGQVVSTLIPGLYQVVWTATSEDGHEISGSYQFEFKPPVEEEDNSSMPYVLAGAVALLVVLAGGFYLWKRPR